MKTKRGTLLVNETLKIILAVIVIVFLIYFLVSLYYSKVNLDKLKQAEAILINSESGSIKIVIDRVKEGQGNLGGDSEKILVNNPEGWYLFSFLDDKKPNSCAGKNCLCICNNVIDVYDRQINECDEGGVCLIVSDLRTSNLEVKIKKGLELLIKYKDGKILIE